MSWRRWISPLGDAWAFGMGKLLRSDGQAARQGAAVLVCFAAAASVLPVLSHRGAEQRADTGWAERAASYQDARFAAAREPEAVVRVSVSGAAGGWSAMATGQLPADAQERAAMRLTPVLETRAVLAGLKALDPGVVRESVEFAASRSCLAEAIYYEARSESAMGQRAVAEVVMNRVRSSAYPDTVCGVVYQGSHLSTGCQFTFTCDGSRRRGPRGPSWERAQRLATLTLMGMNRPLTERATHYHTQAVQPVWSASLVETTRIGAHIFYRFPNQAERRALQGVPVVPYAIDEGLLITPETDVITPDTSNPATQQQPRPGDQAMVVEEGSQHAAARVEVLGAS